MKPANLDPVCPDCHAKLELSIGFTGADWECEAGDGSGFGYQIALDCTGCTRTFTLGHIREQSHFSPRRRFGQKPTRST